MGSATPQKWHVEGFRRRPKLKMRRAPRGSITRHMELMGATMIQTSPEVGDRSVISSVMTAAPTAYRGS